MKWRRFKQAYIGVVGIELENESSALAMWDVYHIHPFGNVQQAPRLETGILGSSSYSFSGFTEDWR